MVNILLKLVTCLQTTIKLDTHLIQPTKHLSTRMHAIINTFHSIKCYDLRCNPYKYASNIHAPLIQHYVIKFISDLTQVGGFLQVLRFSPPITLTATT